MIIVADPENRFRSWASAELAPLDGKVVGTDTIQGLLDLVEELSGELDVVIIGPDVPSDEALEVTEKVRDRAPEVSLLLITKAYSTELLHAALRAGVRDVLPLSFTTSDLTEAVTRAQGVSQQLRTRLEPLEVKKATSHKVITIFSSKGGSGKSFVASNLAILLADSAEEGVGLVDLDLQSGDLAIMLQIVPAWTVFDAVEHLHRLDASHRERFDIEALRGYLSRHSSGVDLLAAPMEAAKSESVSAEAVHHLLHMLKSAFSYIVVDGPAYFTDQVLAALDESDECILIASMDVPNIKNLKLALQTLEQLGFPRERIKLVLNRADSKVGLNLGEVEKSIGTNIDISIPSSRHVPLSINQGTPIVSLKGRSSVSAALRRLAEAVQSPTPPGS